MELNKFPGFEDLKYEEAYPCKINKVKDEEFARTLGSTYVDHAASTLYSERQLEDIFAFYKSTLLSNPHSRHLPSDITTEAIESIRNRILNHFNTNNNEYDVIFTSGATDAIKIVGNYFEWTSSQKCNKSGGIFAYTEESHTSILGLRESANAKGAKVHCIEIDTVEHRFQTPTNIHVNEEYSENCLFSFPAQSNFSGTKYPLSWIQNIQDGQLNLDDSQINFNIKKSTENGNRIWYVLLDAASFVATSPLDLSKYKPDFVSISFYKIFGYPTGLGCLLVSKRAWHCLHKPYFGGGTVLMADSKSMALHRRKALHEEFEDGTLPFLNIISLQQGFDSLLRITGKMENIEQHVFNLSRYLTYNLRSLHHQNGRPVAEVYSSGLKMTVSNHGSIVNFNLKYSNGDYVGYSHVEKVASLSNIYLRTGCVCNPGGCQKYLNITSDKIKHQFEAGHVCGDLNDIVDGCPTGSVRVSFGYMSTYDDADAVLKMIKECFVDGQPVFYTSWYKPEVEVTKDFISTYKMQNGHKLSFVNGTNVNSSEEVKPSLELESKSNCLTEIKDIDLSRVKDENLSTITIDRSTPVSVGDSNLFLTDIIVYPVKSCAGICVSQWPIGPFGLRYDRHWAIVTSSGITLTLKRNPKLSLLKPLIDEEKKLLTLSYEGFESMSLDLTSSYNNKKINGSKFCSGRVCGDKINGLDCGDEVGSWLSSVFEMTNLRLVRQIEARKSKLGNNGNEAKKDLSLANESQYLAIHRPSLRQLIQHMNQNGQQQQIPQEEEMKLRFRPNFVFDGGLPYEEDTWESFTLQDYHFKVLGNCIRCQMVCVNPNTGERSKEPMLTLGKDRGPTIPFGVHAFISRSEKELPFENESNGCLKVGIIAFVNKRINEN